MSRYVSWVTKLKTYLKLGVINLARVFFYRLRLKFRIHPVQKIKAKASSGPFYYKPKLKKKIFKVKKRIDSIHLFGWYRIKIGNQVPDWFKDPLSNYYFTNMNKNWWDIEDFGKYDLKCIWELSRFNWIVAFSLNIINGDKSALKRLNDWLSNWSKLNKPYKGPHWKCAQECSIRVINLITGSWILGQDHNPENGLIDLIKTHMCRIEKTLSYAIAQQNNHAITESAALFLGGSFLMKYDKRADQWSKKGRRLLESHLKNFVEQDGTFSQYSINYQRSLLDVCSLIEAWRKHRGLKKFSKNYINKLSLATKWLLTFIDHQNGSVPNIGANDGSLILQLSNSDYRDYRPTAQLAASLFLNTSVFGDGKWNKTLNLLGLKRKKIKSKIYSNTFNDGGYHILRKKKFLAVLIYPKFRFRPSQADALHLDFWHKGRNLLRDSGTFSYNSNLTDWYSSTAAHNTIEFDGKSQMPKISNFLFGDWLNTKEVKKVRKQKKVLTASASYKDSFNNFHLREISLSDTELICYDRIDGAFNEACLRWRLIDGNWQFINNSLKFEKYSISIKLNGNFIKPILNQTLESCYYQKQNKIPMIQIRVKKPSVLITKLTF